MAYPYAVRLRPLREEVECALETGEGPTLRAARSRLTDAPLTTNEQSELRMIDAMIVTSILELDGIADYLLDDDDARPLAHWWWHLGKIRARRYPHDLLVPHLQVLYNNKKAA